jgi:hypothetical protein
MIRGTSSPSPAQRERGPVNASSWAAKRSAEPAALAHGKRCGAAAHAGLGRRVADHDLDQREGAPGIAEQRQRLAGRDHLARHGAAEHAERA